MHASLPFILSLVLLRLSGLAQAQAPVDDWIRAPALSPHFGLAATHDSARQRVVLFGGADGALWEWAGDTWDRRRSEAGPPPRAFHTLAFDPVRRRVVLFGGLPDGLLVPPTNDTWEWDGNAWLRRLPAVSPPPRHGHAMVFDAARGRTILFGGLDQGRLLNDTWEWDGATWTQRHPTNAPSARAGQAMAYDAVRQRVVLAGGSVQVANLGDTWEWDGQAWTERQPARTPGDHAWQGMVFDTRRNRTVLVVRPSTSWIAETWEWDGTTWTPVNAVTRPDARDQYVLTFDEARGETVLFGGNRPIEANPWTFDGVSWTEHATGMPMYVASSTIVFDSQRERVVAIPGLGIRPGSGLDVWEWDGDRWMLRRPSSGPQARSGHAIAFDQARRRVVMFGGEDSGTGALSDTWEWDGNAWTQRHPSTRPGARAGHAMAYDPTTGHTLLNGGGQRSGHSVSPLGDTWEWDGIAWRVVGNAMLGRYRHAMAFDASRGRVLAVGGLGDGAGPGSTSEWTGTNWQVLQGWASFGGIHGHSLAFDPVRRRLLLAGGRLQNILNDATWVWQAAEWVKLPTISPDPFARLSYLEPATGEAGMAFDEARARLVFVTDTTWLFGETRPAATSVVGAGCGGSAGALVLSSNEPRVGNAHFALEVLSARPDAPAVFAVGLTSAAVPIGPCTLYVPQPFLTVARTSNAAGFASLPLPLPAMVRLRGLTLYAQAFVLEPQPGPFALAFSAGRELRLGD